MINISGTGNTNAGVSRQFLENVLIRAFIPLTDRVKHILLLLVQMSFDLFFGVFRKLEQNDHELGPAVLKIITTSRVSALPDRECDCKLSERKHLLCKLITKPCS